MLVLTLLETRDILLAMNLHSYFRIPLLLFTVSFFMQTATAQSFEEWIARAEAGDSDAQWKLGYRYYNGSGKNKDFKKAEKWFRKAAEQGDAHAQFHLGQMYERGEGLRKDVVLARVWYKIAAANGNEDGSAIFFVEEKMTPEQIEKATELADKMIKENPKLIKKETSPHF